MHSCNDNRISRCSLFSFASRSSILATWRYLAMGSLHTCRPSSECNSIDLWWQAIRHRRVRYALSLTEEPALGEAAVNLVYLICVSQKPGEISLAGKSVCDCLAVGSVRALDSSPATALNLVGKVLRSKQQLLSAPGGYDHRLAAQSG